MALFTSRIPFRYERAFTLGRAMIHPDFTICGLSSSSPPAKPRNPPFSYSPLPYNKKYWV